MLVVITLIGLLMVLFIPAIGSWQTNARAMQGLHNVRQLVEAAQRYAAEHHGKPPMTDFSSWPDPSGYTRWVDEIIPYVYGTVRTNSSGQPMVDGTFRCPGLTGYKNLGNRWNRWEWNEVDWMPVYAERPVNEGYRNVNILTTSASKMPFLVSTDKNSGATGLAQGDQAGFDTYVPPSVWIFNHGILVGYYDGHAEIVRNPNSTNIFKQ